MTARPNLQERLSILLDVRASRKSLVVHRRQHTGAERPAYRDRCILMFGLGRTGESPDLHAMDEQCEKKHLLPDGNRVRRGSSISVHAPVPSSRIHLSTVHYRRDCRAGDPRSLDRMHAGFSLTITERAQAPVFRHGVSELKRE